MFKINDNGMTSLPMLNELYRENGDLIHNAAAEIHELPGVWVVAANILTTNNPLVVGLNNNNYNNSRPAEQ